MGWPEGSRGCGQVTEFDRALIREGGALGESAGEFRVEGDGSQQSWRDEQMA